MDTVAASGVSPATEAPTGFDLKTNGFTDQGTMNKARADFAEEEEIADGLGPVFNNNACSVCHAQPASGGGGIEPACRAAGSSVRGIGPVVSVLLALATSSRPRW